MEEKPQLGSIPFGVLWKAVCFYVLLTKALFTRLRRSPGLHHKPFLLFTKEKKQTLFKGTRAPASC